MILRMSSTVMIFALATIFGGPFANNVSENSDINPDQTDQVQAVNAVFKAEQLTAKKARSEEVVDMVRDFSSGEKSAELIQQELSDVAGESAAIEWDAQHIKGPYKLSQILTHIQDLETNFELLHLYTLPDTKTPEDEVTHYTNKIYDADAQNLAASLVISRDIKIENGRPVFDDKNRALYSFSAKTDSRLNNFGLRAPEGTHSIEPASAQSFDPLGELNSLNSTFHEIGEYQYEMPVGEKVYNVTITPRQSEFQTLTLEVEIRDVNSIVTNTFVLVYEAQ